MFDNYVKMQRKAGVVNEPLTNDELYSFQKTANAQLGHFLPFHYAEFMKTANGYINGDKMIYCADTGIVYCKNKMQIPQYVIENFYLIVNHPNEPYLYVGKSDELHYVFDYKDNKYYGVTQGLFKKVIVYPVFETLLREVLIGTT